MLALSLEISADAARAAVPAIEGIDLTRHLVLCGALIAAIAALGFGFRKVVSGAVRARAAKRSLEVLDVLPLGGKQRLSVVRCYDRTFVLGIGDKELTLLAEIDRDSPRAPEAPGAIGEPEVPGVILAPAARDFASLLRGPRPRAEREPERVQDGLFA